METALLILVYLVIAWVGLIVFWWMLAGLATLVILVLTLFFKKEPL